MLCQVHELTGCLCCLYVRRTHLARMWGKPLQLEKTQTRMGRRFVLGQALPGLKVPSAKVHQVHSYEYEAQEGGTWWLVFLNEHYLPAGSRVLTDDNMDLEDRKCRCRAGGFQ